MILVVVVVMVDRRRRSCSNKMPCWFPEWISGSGCHLVSTTSTAYVPQIVGGMQSAGGGMQSLQAMHASMPTSSSQMGSVATDINDTSEMLATANVIYPFLFFNNFCGRRRCGGGLGSAAATKIEKSRGVGCLDGRPFRTQFEVRCELDLTSHF